MIDRNMPLPDMDGDPFEIEDYALSQEMYDREWREYCARWDADWKKLAENKKEDE